jgi:hypothetical protein
MKPARINSKRSTPSGPAERSLASEAGSEIHAFWKRDAVFQPGYTVSTADPLAMADSPSGQTRLSPSAGAGSDLNVPLFCPAPTEAAAPVSVRLHRCHPSTPARSSQLARSRYPTSRVRFLERLGPRRPAVLGAIWQPPKTDDRDRSRVGHPGIESVNTKGRLEAVLASIP